MAKKPKVNFNIPLAQQVAMKAAMKGVRAATLEAKRITQVDILSSFPPRTGRQYKRGKDKWHTASAPGESPAADTGILRATIGTSFEENGRIARGVVFSNQEYGAILELGDGVKERERPWISRLLTDEFRGRILSAFVRASKQGVSGSRRVADFIGPMMPDS